MSPNPISLQEGRGPAILHKPYNKLDLFMVSLGVSLGCESGGESGGASGGETEEVVREMKASSEMDGTGKLQTPFLQPFLHNQTPQRS